MQKQYRNLFLLCLVVAVGSFAMGFAARRYSARPSGARPMWLASLTGGRGLSHSPSQTFAAVLDSLEESFVDKITDEKPLTYGALRQMMDELDDPNSRFLDPEETRDVLDAEDGVFHGIGAVVTIEATHLKDGERRKAFVANVLPDSPAQRAGLHVGDSIVKIDDKWVYQPYGSLRVTPRLPNGAPSEAATPAPGKPVEVEAPEAQTSDEEDNVLFSTHDIMRRLSTDGQRMTLMVMGPGGKSLEQVDVTTAPTTVRAVQIEPAEPAAEAGQAAPTVQMPGGPGVAQIRVGGFTKSVGPELDAALAQATQSGARKLVIDLRGCVGGAADRAVQVASRFLDGSIGTVQRRQGGRDVKVALIAKRTQNAWTGPVAVLVDHSTLGSAELLAGALASRGGATLVGARTFGDGLEHSVIPLRDGSSLLMTTGKFYSTGGEAYQAKGITPGLAVASASEQASAARRLLAKKG